MEALILNKKFEPVGIIDNYKSFIWTDRYAECGDFEICMLLKNGIPSNMQKEYYLWNSDSEHLMIIESFNLETDLENGDSLIVSGRSLESILDRRIIWKQNDSEKLIKTVFTFTKVGDNIVEYNLQEAIEELLNDNIINPSITIRTIPDFIFERSIDPKITDLTIDAQYLGENLYDVISTLCKENEIGFKITLNDKNQFVFKLYAGVDRSYEQNINPYVIFSPDFDNVTNVNYVDSIKEFKNVTLVAGEETSGTDENGDAVNVRDIYVESIDGFFSGLGRREIFTDASDVTSSVDGGTLTAEQYYAHLRKRGIDTLIANTAVEAFEGEVDANRMYTYGEDYFIGDIVQIANAYGHEGRAYISEFVMSCEESGTSAYPTLKAIQKGVYEE